MRLSNENILRYLGFNTQGDLGPWTFYTSQRKGLVWFIKSPPLEPASFLQTHYRNLFRAAARVWNSLPENERDNWLDAAELTHLEVHGYNLFVYVAVTQDASFVPTLERLTGRSLVLPRMPSQ